MTAISRCRVIVPALAVAVLVAAVTPGVRAAPAVAQAVGSERLHRDLAAIVDAGATSALAVIRQDGHVIGAGAGPQRIGRPDPIDPFGRFRAGSVTKSFLATVVLQLVDAGQVGLDAPIGRYVPGIPDADRITVRMLLDHTSGLYNLTDTLPLDPPSGFLAIRWRHWTPAELLSRATAHPLLFPPGTDYAYSDTNYLVLGMLVRRITGHSPAMEIERRIISPLHLHDTDVPTTTDVAGRHAEDYLPMPDGSLVDITRLDPSVLAYAGDVASSADDLNRFFLALTRGRLLRPRTVDLMTTLELPAHDYGLGVERLPLSCGRTAIGHDGDVPGYSTWSFTVPRTGRAVTVSMSWGTERPKDQALRLVDNALCGRSGTPHG